MGQMPLGRGARVGRDGVFQRTERGSSPGHLPSPSPPAHPLTGPLRSHLAAPLFILRRPAVADRRDYDRAEKMYRRCEGGGGEGGRR